MTFLTTMAKVKLVLLLKAPIIKLKQKQNKKLPLKHPTLIKLGAILQLNSVFTIYTANVNSLLLIKTTI